MSSIRRSSPSPCNRRDVPAGGATINSQEMLPVTPSTKRRVLFGNTHDAASPLQATSLAMDLSTPESKSHQDNEPALSPDTLALLGGSPIDSVCTPPTKQEESNEERQQPESTAARSVREEEESLELARALMAEEAMASYQHHFQLLRSNTNNLSDEDMAALNAAMVEDERELQEEHAADVQVDDDGNMSYETMLQLGERIGDVKSERWTAVAQEHIAKLPVFQYQTATSDEATAAADDSELKCLVCQCDYEASESLCRLPCGHCFHSDCVGQWLASKDCCPYCRRCIVKDDAAQNE